MHVAGSDLIQVVDGQVRPVAPWHAVGPDGEVACRDRTAAFTFPVLAWDAGIDADRCPVCVDALAWAELPPAYPVDGVLPVVPHARPVQASGAFA